MAADLLHAGHLNILNVSKEYGRVVVGLVSDEGMKGYKREPVLKYEEREKLLQSLKQVDEVIQLDGVRKSYGDRLIMDDVSMAIPPGSIVGVISEMHLGNG